MVGKEGGFVAGLARPCAAPCCFDALHRIAMTMVKLTHHD